VEYTPSSRLSAALEFTWMRTSQQQSNGLTDAAFAQDAAQSVRARNWFGLDWYAPALRLKYAFSSATSLSLSAFGTIGYRNSTGFNGAINLPDNQGPRTILKDEYNNVGSELRLLHTYTFAGAKHTLSTGVRYYRGKTYRQQGLGSAASDEDYTFNTPEDLQSFDYTLPLTNTAAFAENVFRLTPKLKLVPGLRYEHIQNEADGYYKVGAVRYADQNEVSRDFVLLGLSTSYSFSARAEAYGGISESYRPVTFNDTRVSNPAQRVDPDLEDARGYTANVGLRGSIKEIFSYDVSAFYLSYNNRIGTINAFEGGAPVQLTTNVADARSQGVESYLEVDLARALLSSEVFKLSLFSSAAFVEANYIGSGDSLRSGSSNISVAGKRLELAPKWVLRTGLTAGYKGLLATLQHSYTTLQYTDAFNTESTTSAAAGRIPIYRVWDLSARYRWHALELSAGANNLLDARYFTRRGGNSGLLPGEARTIYVGLAYQL
jgi:Fe(3+) dicitrate transport protein